MTTLYYALQDEQTIYLLCQLAQTGCLAYLVYRHR
jgi:hypothetical protein